MVPGPRIGGSPESEISAAGKSAADAAVDPRFKIGLAALRGIVDTLGGGPGVYRMFGAGGKALYVGKARNLKKRVTSYLNLDRHSNRIRRMVAETRTVEVVNTHTEAEALLLESNLIKKLAPRYNILLRDDKSFPYILIAEDHESPRLMKHRGAHSVRGRYFGPFASAGAVNRTMTALQRAFLLRSCSDSVYAARTRPCLLHQIRRCSAPCVGRIDPDSYAGLVNEAADFLAGRSDDVQQNLAGRMQESAAQHDFETAAIYRDRIRALTQIQSHQDINVEEMGDADVVAAHLAGGQACVQVFFFRGGRNYGSRAYFPRHDADVSALAVMAAFLGQFYAQHAPPRLILVDPAPEDQPVLQEALTMQAGRGVRIVAALRGTKRKVLDLALANAHEALARRMAEGATQRRLLDDLGVAFGLESTPTRIEVYDNSHIQGRQAIGAMVVFGAEGPVKSAYRKFTIRAGAAKGDPIPSGGDDYAMMREVFARRFGRALMEDPERTQGTWPDLVLIDGGQGQLNAAREVLTELGVEELPLVAIAKGPDRDAGRERFFVTGRDPIVFPEHHPVLYFLQRMRDEAHRFAIGFHRAKRAKAMVSSPLDEIAGIGARRKRALLLHFGSARNVARAGLSDLERVAGINRSVAKKIYDHFLGDG